MIEIDPDEKIVAVIRKHWFVLLQHGLFFLFLLFIPLMAFFLARKVGLSELFTLEGSTLFATLFFLSGWVSILWVSMFLTLTDYLLDVIVVTDRRIFTIEQQGLFRRESSAFRIDRIQDVTVEVNGIIETFLDFGTIRIETAGDGKRFIGTTVARPYHVKKMINEEIDRAMETARKVHVVEHGSDGVRHPDEGM